MRSACVTLLFSFVALVASCDEDTPPSTASSAGAKIGPAGGRLNLARGIVLEVPPGALDAETELRGELEAVRAVEDIPGSLLVSIKFTPDGLTFATPARLVVPVSSFEGARADLRLEDVLAISENEPRAVEPRADEESEGVEQAEMLVVDRSDPTTLRIDVQHFSKGKVLDSKVNKKMVRELKNVDEASVNTLGLSRQLRKELLEENPEFLVPIRKHQRIANLDPLANAPGAGDVDTEPLLSKSAEASLAAAADRATTPIGVAFAWRSLATQYVIEHAQNRTLTASEVGKSFHGIGAGIDLVVERSKAQLAEGKKAKDVCIEAKTALGASASADELASRLFPDGVATAMKENDYTWWGIEHDACSDPVHFTYQRHNVAADVKATITAFQNLWNVHNPSRYLNPDGVLGPATREAIGDSPSHGWEGCDTLKTCCTTGGGQFATIGGKAQCLPTGTCPVICDAPDLASACQPVGTDCATVKTCGTRTSFCKSGQANYCTGLDPAKGNPESICCATTDHFHTASYSGPAGPGSAAACCKQAQTWCATAEWAGCFDVPCSSITSCNGQPKFCVDGKPYDCNTGCP